MTTHWREPTTNEISYYLVFEVPNLFNNILMANAESKLDSSIDQLKFLDKDQRRLLFLFTKTFIRDFLLAWMVRGGVGFLPHLLKLFRARRYAN